MYVIPAEHDEQVREQFVRQEEARREIVRSAIRGKLLSLLDVHSLAEVLSGVGEVLRTAPEFSGYKQRSATMANKVDELAAYAARNGM